MVYVTDIMATLVTEVLEYVGEVEHGEDLGLYQDKKTLVQDFATWLQSKDATTTTTASCQKIWELLKDAGKELQDAFTDFECAWMEHASEYHG